MIFGLSTFTFGWAFLHPTISNFTIFHLLDFCHSSGIKILQIGDNFPLLNLSETQLDELKSYSNSKRIKLEIGARKLTDSILTQYIEMCEKLNAEVLRFVVDDDEYEPCILELVEILTSNIKIKENSQLKIVLENHDRFQVQDWIEIISKVNAENVGICLDTANSYGAGEGTAYVIDQLAPFTFNMHIKDITINRIDTKMGFDIRGAISGNGVLNIPEIINKIEMTQKCKSFILEQWVPFTDTFEKTIEKEMQWAIESIKYLKQYENN